MIKYEIDNPRTAKNNPEAETRLYLIKTLQSRRDEIIDDFYDKYCRFLYKYDNRIDKKRYETVKTLKIKCLPVKSKFNRIIDCFISLDDTEDQ
jgi:hypothetical protein